MPRSFLVQRPAALAASLACVGMLGYGCAETLEPAPVSGADAGPVQSSGNFLHTAGPGDITITVVDATDAEAWQYLDLDTSLSAEGEPGWDLAFSRFKVRVNGGVSGEGGARAAFTSEAFDAVSEPPMGTEWTVPVADGPDDDDSDPDNVFNNGTDDWYDYELSNHTLTPKPRTYLIASTERRFYKLAFETYYDDAGSPANIRFRWAEIGAVALGDAGQAMVADAGVAAPDSGTTLPAGAFELDAASRESWVYYQVGTGVVSVETPESSTDWDIAFQRTAIRTNSGTSGPGLGGLREQEGTEGESGYASLMSASTFGFQVDEEVTSGPPGSPAFSASPVDWFDYNPATHSVSPKDTALVLRTADGGYAKLRVWSWESGIYQLSVDPIDRDTAAVTLEVDASDRMSWTHVSLRDGAVISPEGDADLRWDLAISRVLFRTNGGTSGSGEGGAVLLGETALSDVSAMPADGWTVDETITSERPGVMPYSGNPVLGDWFNYDGATRTASPKAVSFAVRTADGSLAAIQIQNYDDGRFTLGVRYAGPGETSL